ncbi:MAG: hypothetical protein DWQ36_08235 [Acidobacteria bacterium]|nr:MAG: hypothetical protein DWQ30_01960 [Acidobacteriota bacterium]REK08796.1 MAG: hypothetical protein DWQ36_08235 [Acidobacteriota bacterium]
MRRLHLVKMLHTAAWAFFVACILAIPVATLLGRRTLALVFVAIVAVEVVVLLFNRMACPLTAVAARYTEDRRANFDIYLPEWLARHNKTLFGTLYIASIVLLLVRWPR